MTVKSELLEMKPDLTKAELKILEKLCYILVGIDNLDKNSKRYGYDYQNELIELARKHNGDYGI